MNQLVSHSVELRLFLNLQSLSIHLLIGFVPHIYHFSEGIDRLPNFTVTLISGQLGLEVVTVLNTKSGVPIQRVMLAPTTVWLQSMMMMVCTHN